MKIRKRIILLVITMLLISQTGFTATNSVSHLNRNVKINGKNKPFKQVTVNLNDKDIKVGVATGHDSLAKPENFTNIMKRKNTIAGINGNYFDAYTTMEPIGAVMVDGKFKHLEGSCDSLVVDSNGATTIGRHRIRVNAYLDDEATKHELTNVNKIVKDKNIAQIFTPIRGSHVNLFGGTSIEVRNNKITKLIKSSKKVNIPKDGYIIHYGSNRPYEQISKAFRIGRKVRLENDISMARSTTKENLPNEHTRLFGKAAKDFKSNKYIDGLRFNVWLINSNPTDTTGVYLYTPEKGSSINTKGGHAVIVQNNKVFNMYFNINNFNIPKDGYVIYFGKDIDTGGYNKEKFIKDRFSLGDEVKFFNNDTKVFNTENIIKNAVNKNQADIAGSSNTIFVDKPQATISAGPLLTQAGKVVFNPNSTSFKENKIAINRAQRSAVGITKHNRLLLITAPNVTMLEFAQIMKQIGAVDSMNLDGGASSGLYSKGKVLTSPGRNLHTVLTINNKSKK